MSIFILKSIIFSELDFRKISEAINQDNGINKLSDYNIWSIDHVKTVFRWELFNSESLFFLVILITLSGIILSYAQFHDNNKDEQKSTTIKISKDGVEISSSIIGIIILIVSLIFLYIYLIYIYPIEFLDPIISKTT